MASLPNDGSGPLRLPPTLPPKRVRVRPRWLRPLIGALVLVLTAVGVSSMLNNEVSRRLATVPPPSTAPSTTLAPPVTAPAPVPQVAGARVRRPNAPTSSTTSTTTPEAPAAMAADTPSEIIAALEKLPVEDEHGGHQRTRFGFYTDADGDACDTREEVVVAEALQIEMNVRNCNIFSGKWFSAFDGLTVENARGLDTEHLVSLEEAYESGAWKWSSTERNAYLNDLTHPEAILAVSDASSVARNDEDPGRWLPSNDAYLCDYLRNWVYMKTLYKMSVDPGERESIAASSLHC